MGWDWDVNMSFSGFTPLHWELDWTDTVACWMGHTITLGPNFLIWGHWIVDLGGSPFPVGR